MAGHFSSQPLAADQKRWSELVGMLNVEELLATFLPRLDAIEGYSEGMISADERDSSSRRVFEQLIARIRGDECDLQTVAFELGAARARRGLPRSSLYTAINFDYHIIWNALIAVAGADDAELLLRHADFVWSVIDEFGRVAQDGYLAEREQLEGVRLFQQRALLAEIVEADREPDPASARKLAELVGLPVDTKLVMLAAAGSTAANIRKHAAVAQQRDETVLMCYHASTLYVLIPEVRWRSNNSLAPLRNTRECAQLELRNFNEIWAGVHVGADLARLPVRSDGSRRTLDDWPLVVRRRVENSPLGRLVNIAPTLKSCNASERRILEDSIRAYLETGSVRDAAARMYCHRNTMTNRLRRFTELTGLDVTVPVDAARVVMAWA